MQFDETGVTFNAVFIRLFENFIMRFQMTTKITMMKSKIYCQLTRQKDFDEMLFYIDDIR